MQWDQVHNHDHVTGIVCTIHNYARTLYMCISLILQEAIASVGILLLVIDGTFTFQVSIFPSGEMHFVYQEVCI